MANETIKYTQVTRTTFGYPMSSWSKDGVLNIQSLCVKHKKTDLSAKSIQKKANQDPFPLFGARVKT